MDVSTSQYAEEIATNASCVGQVRNSSATVLSMVASVGVFRPLEKCSRLESSLAFMSFVFARFQRGVLVARGPVP